MIFNSLEFLAFFVAVMALYFAVPHRFRWMLLLGASCVFYMALIPAYILVLFATIATTFASGRLTERSEGRARKAWLWTGIACACAVLFAFKYFDFFNANFHAVASLLGWNYSLEALQLILPIGISFHTFQSLSYLIEVYRHKQAAERHAGIFSLYILFWPQLMAGPIERPQAMLPQFRERMNFDAGRVAAGLKLMLWGFFKKIAIADRLALVVDGAYGNPSAHSASTLWIATVFFTFQVYCDFSGYSDIARGAAKVMGFRLTRNFNFPYASRSMGEYWRRWHISLSNWLRDYLYIPLGGSWHGRARWCAAILITFFVSGLWHGGSWTFVTWGVLHGLYLVAGKFLEPARASLADRIGLGRIPWASAALAVLSTFLIVALTRVFFRADSMAAAGEMLSRMAGFGAPATAAFPVGTGALLLDLGLLAFLEAAQWLERRGVAGRWALQARLPVRWGICYLLVLGIALIGEFGSARFIYFQF